jgi:hypothetical protein
MKIVLAVVGGIGAVVALTVAYRRRRPGVSAVPGRIRWGLVAVVAAGRGCGPPRHRLLLVGTCPSCGIRLSGSPLVAPWLAISRSETRASMRGRPSWRIRRDKVP